tara:strand:+ start:2366 stop:3280 length:915 start_codon:yes stop_codon:yes gene_type:complete
MATLTYRIIKGSPLTNQEIDDNFSDLNTEVGTKLTSTDYTAADVLSKLLTVDGSGTGLDADLLDGLHSDTANTNSTIVARDASGNFSAGTITATQFSGNLYLGTTNNVTFEGATPDGFETTLTATDPTADRTITFPDESGTVVLSGGAGSIGSVTNEMISGSITNDKLVNSTITIDGNAVSLGGSVSIASADITWTGAQTFRDNKFVITDNVDTTKVLNLQISNIATATTRTLTAPDLSGTIAISESTVLTGTPTAPTAAGGTNTTQIATTAYVQNIGYNSQGAKTISSGTPSGGTSGDIWYRV